MDNDNVVSFKTTLADPMLSHQAPEETEKPKELSALDHLKQAALEIEKIGEEQFLKGVVILQFTEGFAIKSLGPITLAESLGSLEIGKHIIFGRMDQSFGPGMPG